MSLHSLLEEQIKTIKSWLPAIEYLAEKHSNKFNFSEWECDTEFNEDLFETVKILPEKIRLSHYDPYDSYLSEVHVYIPISEIEEFMKNQDEYIEKYKKLKDERKRIETRISELYEHLKSYKDKNVELKRELNAYKLLRFDTLRNPLTASDIVDAVNGLGEEFEANRAEIKSIEKEINELKDYLKTLKQRLYSGNSLIG